ncbi:hypothetical protein Prudu_003360, partial [Prunus dulcis]
TLRETGHRLPEGAGAASESNGHGTGGVGTAIESPTFSTDLNPGAALSWPENRVFRRRFVRSYPNFQLEILLRHRNMRDPPPSHSNPPHHHVRGDSAEISAEV